MKPNWQKLASLAQKYAHFSLSSLVQSLLPRDTLLRTYFSSLYSYSITMDLTESFQQSSVDGRLFVAHFK